MRTWCQLLQRTGPLSRARSPNLRLPGALQLPGLSHGVCGPVFEVVLVCPPPPSPYHMGWKTPLVRGGSRGLCARFWRAGAPARSGGLCAQMCSQPLLPAPWVPEQLQQWTVVFPERAGVSESLPLGATHKAGHTTGCCVCKAYNRVALSSPALGLISGGGGRDS